MEEGNLEQKERLSKADAYIPSEKTEDVTLSQFFNSPQVRIMLDSDPFMSAHYDIQYSKIEYHICIQTSFRDVNTNNASSGLRGKVITLREKVVTFSLRPDKTLLVLTS